MTSYSQYKRVVFRLSFNNPTTLSSNDIELYYKNVKLSSTDLSYNITNDTYQKNSDEDTLKTHFGPHGSIKIEKKNGDLYNLIKINLYNLK